MNWDRVAERAVVCAFAWIHGLCVQAMESDVDRNYQLVKEVLVALGARWATGVPHFADFTVLGPHVHPSHVSEAACLYATLTFNWHKEHYKRRGGKGLVRETRLRK